jgi:hypothetical protein
MRPTQNEPTELELGEIKATLKTGKERFKGGDIDQQYTLSDFWKWSASDLLSNATRGRLAEFIVAKALGGSGGDVRDEWGAYDITMPGGIKLEVKSAAYLQSWPQKRFSTIMFSIKATQYVDEKTREWIKTPKRQANVYVFALLAHKLPKQGVDPLNLDQWRFYVSHSFSTNQGDDFTEENVRLDLYQSERSSPKDDPPHERQLAADVPNGVNYSPEHDHS